MESINAIQKKIIPSDVWMKINILTSIFNSKLRLYYTRLYFIISRNTSVEHKTFRLCTPMWKLRFYIYASKNPWRSKNSWTSKNPRRYLLVSLSRFCTLRDFLLPQNIYSLGQILIYQSFYVAIDGSQKMLVERCLRHQKLQFSMKFRPQLLGWLPTWRTISHQTIWM